MRICAALLFCAALLAANATRAQERIAPGLWRVTTLNDGKASWNNDICWDQRIADFSKGSAGEIGTALTEFHQNLDKCSILVSKATRKRIVYTQSCDQTTLVHDTRFRNPRSHIITTKAFPAGGKPFIIRRIAQRIGPCP